MELDFVVNLAKCYPLELSSLLFSVMKEKHLIGVDKAKLTVV